MSHTTAKRTPGARLAGVLALLSTLAFGDEFQSPPMTPEALAARLGTPQAPLVVDVRPPGEYKSGHIVGAVNIPHTKLDKRLEGLRQASNGIVLYCTFGERTRLAEQTLLDHQVPNLYHLEGGLAAWRQGGHKLTVGWGD